MFGRRDRCLLVLSQLAGVPYQHLATLTAGDISIADGVATIRSPAGEWTARSGRRRGLVRAVRGRPVAEDPGPGRHQTEHQDHRPRPEEARTRSITGRRTSARPGRSSARRPGACRCCRRSTNGAPCPSRCNDSPRTRCPAASGTSWPGTSARTATYPSTPTRNRSCTAPETPPVITPAAGNAYDAVDAAAAWDRRRRDLQDLAGIIDVLTDVERRADELNRRAAELVEGWL